MPSVGVSRISNAIFTPLAFNSARTAGRFLTSKPKCFTPCVRKSSDGFFLDSGSGAASVQLEELDGDVAAPKIRDLLAGAGLAGAHGPLEAEHLLVPGDRFGDVRHAQRDVIPGDVEADGIAGARVGPSVSSVPSRTPVPAPSTYAWYPAGSMNGLVPPPIFGSLSFRLK